MSLPPLLPPSPATAEAGLAGLRLLPAPAPAASGGLHPAFHADGGDSNWMLLSNLDIIFNKWIIGPGGFPYPVLLSCWHLVFATVLTQLLAHTTSLLDSRHSLPMTSRLYLRAICPIGIFYSASLICSNLVYVHLSLSFIQILKSAAPVAVLFVSWIWRVEDPSVASLVKILIIVTGVALASVGEIQFSMIGFIYQNAGTIFEAIRLVMTQILLGNRRTKMDPLVGLYYYAPICAVVSVLFAIPTELSSFQSQDIFRTGVGILSLNALAAFLLNVAGIILIGKTSGLTMSLCGILKSILLIWASVLFWDTKINLTQCSGYAIAVAGLVYYSVGDKELSRVAHTTMAWASAPFGFSNGLKTVTLGKVVLVATIALCVIFFATNSRRYDSSLTLPPFKGAGALGGGLYLDT